MSQFLLIVTLGVHLLCVNVASAAPLLAVWLEWREARGQAWAGRAGRRLTTAAIVALLLGALLGLGLGYLLWTPAYRELLERLWSKIFYGLCELLFSLVLLAVHLAWWALRPQVGRGQRLLRMLLPLLAGTNLIYHFPFLFTILAQLAAEGAHAGPPIDAAAFRQLLIEPLVLARVSHFALAAVATSGLLLAWLCKTAGETAADTAGVLAGARIALTASLLQIPVGGWLLVQTPAMPQSRMLGGDAAATLLFVAAMLGVLALLHQLSAVAMGETQRRTVATAGLLLALVVVLMTGALRQSYPARAASPAANSTPSTSQSTIRGTT